jgi:hypothetical protein
MISQYNLTHNLWFCDNYIIIISTVGGIIVYWMFTVGKNASNLIKGMLVELPPKSFIIQILKLDSVHIRSHKPAPPCISRMGWLI